jgi:hypothetical protein
MMSMVIPMGILFSSVEADPEVLNPEYFGGASTRMQNNDSIFFVISLGLLSFRRRYGSIKEEKNLPVSFLKQLMGLYTLNSGTFLRG